jgi:predicted metal-dependent peptidase
MDKYERIIKLSREVLQFSRNTIIVNLRFLDAALSRLLSVSNNEILFGTDGRYIVYNPDYLLKRYTENANSITHDYLHTLLHCIFRHNFVDPKINRRIWNLASDIAVENIINSLNVRFAEIDGKDARERECTSLNSAVNTLTAEKLYNYLLGSGLPENRITMLEKEFYADDHRLWYMTSDEKKAAGIGDNSGSNDDSDRDNKNNNRPDNSSQSGYNGSEICSEDDWKEIAKRIQVDMETLSKSQGNMAGGLLEGLREVNRERYDYTAFLKKFAVMGEAMQVNDDEFDYVFYTYGLKLYKNMPLIEPLEYKEVKRIREFVIAIDTSGSVEGELVQTFLQKTYNIMKQTESFFSRINIHIIQCDADIQEHIRITSQKEFDEYLKTLKIRGFGGTDFRPVFRMVDRLIEEKEFSNLRGMIYFTDGWGTFPAKKPKYETAFVFIKEDYFNENVPPWAIKLILNKDEI